MSRTLAAIRASQYPVRNGARLRLVVSLNQRLLSAVAGRDTVFRAPVGVATGLRLAFAGRLWRFRTPRGTRRVLRKTENPVWTPPDWHYAETAYNYGLRLARLAAKGVSLRTGAKLVIRDSVVGIIYPGRQFAMLPTDEHLVFDRTVFIPPVGTLNRRVTESLGDFALDLGGGYLIHGTSNEASIGQASSHGCIRVRHEDIEWLYDNVPVGTPVLIH
ncbi:MAG: L,D-transpeptidase [Gemmatimonadaceae bacterium]